MNTFDAPTTGTDLCPTLAANTTYFVVVERVDFSSLAIISVRQTNSSNEDTGGAVGWSIENRSELLDDGMNTEWGQAVSRPYMIEVTGTPLSTGVVFSYRWRPGTNPMPTASRWGTLRLRPTMWISTAGRSRRPRPATTPASAMPVAQRQRASGQLGLGRRCRVP